MASTKHSPPARPELFASPQRESAVQFVLSRVQELLSRGELAPGSRLPTENELTRQLNVSRGSLREALKILQAFGVVEIRRGDGTYVSESMSASLIDPLVFRLLLSSSDKRKLMELRELIELGIGRLILQNAEDADIARLEEQYRDMERRIEAGERDPEVLTECDLNFHRTLGAATRNELIQRVYEFVLDALAPSIRETHVNEASGRNALRLHRGILDALSARDSAAATAAIRRSIEEWVRLF